MHAESSTSRLDSQVVACVITSGMLDTAIARGSPVPLAQLMVLDDDALLPPPPSCRDLASYYHYAAQRREEFPGLEPNSPALRWDWASSDCGTTSGRVRIVMRYFRGLWSLDIESGTYRGQWGVDYIRRWLAMHERPAQFDPLDREWRLIERAVGLRTGARASPMWALGRTVDDIIARASRPPGKIMQMRRRTSRGKRRPKRR